MLSKTLISLFILSGCGNNITLKENKLENLDSLSSSTNTSYKKYGTLKKGSPSLVTFEGRNYIVSIYSSKSAIDFIKSLPVGAQVSVVFTGGIDNNEYVIETIERK
jgi:hypothetical protein